MNNISQDKTFAAFTLKSGSKEKSIHSYITKICLLIRDVKNIEIKAYEILKRKLNDLKYKIDICYENLTKQDKLIKCECMKVNLTIDEAFMKINSQNIEKLVNEDDKREIPKLKSKENFEEKCLDNINEFFK